MRLIGCSISLFSLFMKYDIRQAQSSTSFADDTFNVLQTMFLSLTHVTHQYENKQQTVKNNTENWIQSMN